MKAVKATLAVITLMASSACFAGEPWDNTDKALFAGFLAASAVDVGQTLNMIDRKERGEDYREVNPLLGGSPSKSKVIGFAVASRVLVWFVADHVSPKTRKALLTGALAVEIGVAANNARIGLKVGF